MGGLCYGYAKNKKKKRLIFYSSSLLTNLDKGVSIEKPHQEVSYLYFIKQISCVKYGK